jgi:hypothetical protein
MNSTNSTRPTEAPSMSVFLREGTWVVTWRNAAGRWQQRRTPCDTKAEARALATSTSATCGRPSTAPSPSNAATPR